MTPFNRRSLAENGEKMAGRYLAKKGFRIVEKNYRTPFGEIDIIARDREQLVFCEVKTRVSGNFGTPLTSITGKKKKHILMNSLYFLKKHALMDTPWRMDVIGIKLDHKGELEILRYVKNAFEMDPRV